MIQAVYSDKKQIVDILTKSFSDNLSVNYMVGQGKRRDIRIRRLMEYSFDVCFHYGEIFLSENKKGCALLVLPDKKKTTIRSIIQDMKLITLCIGLLNVRKAIKRESQIKKLQPKEKMYYLWFIGVDPAHQNEGTGGELVQGIIKKSVLEKRIICLETSTRKNVPWYQKFGFIIYNKLGLGYELFFLKRETVI